MRPSELTYSPGHNHSQYRKSCLKSSKHKLIRPRSILQGGYHHPTLRTWQNNGRNLTKDMFVYPIFISDDPDAEQVINSLPGQKRWGLNRLEGFLRPLVEKGLKGVILFGVPMKMEKVCSASSRVRYKDFSSRPGRSRLRRRRSRDTRHPGSATSSQAIPSTHAYSRCLPLRVHLPRTLRNPFVATKPRPLESTNT